MGLNQRNVHGMFGDFGSVLLGISYENDSDVQYFFFFHKTFVQTHKHTNTQTHKHTQHIHQAIMALLPFQSDLYLTGKNVNSSLFFFLFLSLTSPKGKISSLFP